MVDDVTLGLFQLFGHLSLPMIVEMYTVRRNSRDIFSLCFRCQNFLGRSRENSAKNHLASVAFYKFLPLAEVHKDFSRVHVRNRRHRLCGVDDLLYDVGDVRELHDSGDMGCDFEYGSEYDCDGEWESDESVNIVVPVSS